MVCGTLVISLEPKGYHRNHHYYRYDFVDREDCRSFLKCAADRDWLIVADHDYSTYEEAERLRAGEPCMGGRKDLLSELIRRLYNDPYLDPQEELDALAGVEHPASVYNPHDAVAEPASCA